MSDSASEYEYGRFFDPLPQHRMQAGACHDVRRPAKDRARRSLHIHQLVESELTSGVVEKEVDIGFAPCLIARGRTQHVQMVNPEPF